MINTQPSTFCFPHQRVVKSVRLLCFVFSANKMDGLLIFDQQNDVIYTKFNDQMKTKLYELALEQELIEVDAVRISHTFTLSFAVIIYFKFQVEKDFLNPNVLIQIFSPIIASQRIMTCQFDNSYSSLECEGNINFVFEEVNNFLIIQSK